ncbi:MAG TPA: trypsin-like serine protease [Stenomitos sp.]
MTRQLVRYMALSAAFVVSLPFVVSHSALASRGSLSYPSQTLAKSDRRAKLDPKLLGVPPAPQPITGKARSYSSASREIGYDLRTKAVKIVSLPRVRTTLRQAIEPSSPGFDTADQQEPRIRRNSQSALDTHNRVLITRTTASPWRVLTKLYMTFPNGQMYSCSGTLIAAQYVLTAGHCIYRPDEGGWAKKVEAIPGLNETYKPYGSAFSTKIRTFVAWTSAQDANYDIALVTLDRAIGNTTGWLGYGHFSALNGVTGNLAGYPSDQGGVNLYYHAGPLSKATPQQLHYPIEAYSGQSGSGIYRIYTPSGGTRGRYVLGVHSATNGDSNIGTRIDAYKFNALESWISSGS